MLIGWVLILGRRRISAIAANAALVVMTLVTIAGAVVVAGLGTEEDDGAGQETVSRQ